MRFRSDLELAIWLWRHFSPQYEGRSLVLCKNAVAVEKIEKIINQETTWRFDETAIADMFSGLPSEMLDYVRRSLKDLAMIVEGERENGWLEELLQLRIQSTASSSACDQSLFELVDMLICLLSSSIDQRDAFSATRFFTILCPEVLPPLRRLSQQSTLTMQQTLVSYIMEATIQNNAGPDPVLGMHIDFLKSFDRAVDQIHEQMIDVPDVKLALQTSVQTAANFLLSTRKYTCNSKVRLAQRFIQQQIPELVANYNILVKIAPNKEQKAPSFISSRERLCRLIIDRITVMDIPQAINTGMSPVFRTPLVEKSAVVGDNAFVDECSTPKVEEKKNIKIASFVDNGTPTPIRPSAAMSLCDDFDEVSGDSGIYADLLDEEKENVDPNGKLINNQTENVPLKPIKNVTPQRPKSKGLRVRGDGDNRPSKRTAEKTVNPTKHTSHAGKRNKPTVATNQKSITSFFNRN